MATRWTFGAICVSISSDFPIMEYSRKLKPVMLPPGRAKFAIKPWPTGSLTKTKDDRDGAGCIPQRRERRRPISHKHVGCQSHQFRRISANAINIARRPTIF